MHQDPDQGQDCPEAQTLEQEGEQLVDWVA